jgi:tRNA-Thr(GGU) m(6)t(6)A37 methyltransferase TsaA
VDENQFKYQPIGWIETPFESPEGMPIQPAGAEETEGTVRLEQEYVEGLRDLDGFSHCILIYHLHRANDGEPLRVEPFLYDTERGLFATRAPQRPNPIGLSVVKIDTVEGGEITVTGIDVVNETPLLDIKPFVPGFDSPSNADTGWLDVSPSDIRTEQSDERFTR